MANKKSVGPAGPGEVKAAWFMPEQMVRVPIGELVPYARNARTHSESQIAQIRASLREFGFVNPVIIDSDRNIIAGHGRVLAAKAEGMTEVPCVLVEHLTDAQRRAYILAAANRMPIHPAASRTAMCGNSETTFFCVEIVPKNRI